MTETNILNLPKLSGSGTVFEVTTNADWSDTLFFPAINSPVATTRDCSMVQASNQIAVNISTTGLVFQQGIVGPGIPDGTMIMAVTGPYSVIMMDEQGFVVYATATQNNVNVTFEPLGLNLAGIDFVANLRVKASLAESILTVRTTDSTFLTTWNGRLAFNLLQTRVKDLPPGEYVMDIVAIADDQHVNLFPDGPATVTVIDGVTDPETLTP